MGGGGKGGGTSISVPTSPYELSLANIATDYFAKTDPLRNMFYQDWGNFLRPGMALEYNRYNEPGVNWAVMGQGTGGYTYSPYATYTGTIGTYGGPGGGSVTYPGGTVTSGTSGIAPSSGGTTAGITGAGTSAPLSSNFNMPSAADISRNLNTAYGNYANSPQASQYLANLGYNMEPTVGVSPGTPEWNSWLGNTANEIRSNLLQTAMQSPQTSGQATIPGGRGSNMTSSGLYNPYNLPAYAPLYQLARTGIESQYNPARQNILSSTPRGGALYENLANLEMNRAQQAGALPATIAAPLIQDIMNKAYGAAFQMAPTQASGMLSGAASDYAQRFGAQGAYQANQANQGSSVAMGLGAGLGGLIGKGLGK